MTREGSTVHHTRLKRWRVLSSARGEVPPTHHRVWGCPSLRLFIIIPFCFDHKSHVFGNYGLSLLGLVHDPRILYLRGEVREPLRCQTCCALQHDGNALTELCKTPVPTLEVSLEAPVGALAFALTNHSPPKFESLGPTRSEST